MRKPQPIVNRINYGAVVPYEEDFEVLWWLQVLLVSSISTEVSSRQRLIWLAAAALLLCIVRFSYVFPHSLRIIEEAEIFRGALRPQDPLYEDGGIPPPEDFDTIPEVVKPEPDKEPENVTEEKPDEKPKENDTFNGLPELCKQTKWTEGLWLHCHSGCGENKLSMCGGLNNARNRIQTCFRLAIDAGTGVIMAPVTNRAEEQLMNTNGEALCPEHFWDMEYLQSKLQEHCPQLHVRMCDDRLGIEKTVIPQYRDYNSDSYVLGTFRQYVETSLSDSNISITDINPSDQVILEFGDGFTAWNYKTSNEIQTIRKALFKTLKFNQDLLNLSSHVLQSPELNNGAFFGLHLRGEDDWPGGFGSADDQKRVYAEEIERIQINDPIKTIYVSCGDQEAIQKFRDMMEPNGYKVHDKWSLLANQPEKFAQIEALTFDQKAIVEYQVLVDAKP
ncbi:hypothetical protein G7Y89_g12882 [Cudoniella acicularis]|uniref:Uncharacterized protein n=1 Tax=Cudoniella acicularis TaxID=354080 RepID=A0A8H4R8D9_9HELO|nr:hypothetical protein G7Y89_g12882 [Cudoniella acicularis]